MLYGLTRCAPPRNLPVAFIATAVSGLVVLLAGFAQADAVATLIMAAFLLKAGYGLARETGRIFLQAAEVAFAWEVADRAAFMDAGYSFERYDGRR
jgi:cobalt-zinc-cadmium efflux system protein